MKKLISGLGAFLIIFSQFSFLAAPLTAHAAVSDWIKGSTVVPTSQTDFSSGSFQQSLQNLKATGATYVALIVPYYQSNLYSSDIGPGWNTPTDAALSSAIDYAHSIGLAVTVIIHNESYSGDWRAYINPSDRNAWYANYNNELQHVGTIAQAHHAEMFIMGTEMVSIASSYVNADNTTRWQTLIANVRKIYTGKLTYDANSTSNNYNAFQDEKESIGFWNLLDYAGLSVYYGLNSDNSVAGLEGQWDYWNNNDLKGFQQRIGKQLLFSEIGYRSADNAHYAPWNSSGGSYNATEQVNDYDALMGYWNNYPYVAGVMWWNWQSDPNGGGSGNTDYTVQNKPAQATLTKWFTTGSSSGGGGTTPPPTTAPAVTSSATVNPANPQPNSAVAIAATVKNTGGAVQNGIVDVEVYNSAGTKVFQQAFTGQNLANGSSNNFNANWASGGPVGTYKVAVGVFNNDWTQNYSWNGSAATINVAAASTPPPTTAPGITSSTTANPASPQAGAQTAVSTTISNNGGALSNAIVDIEIYNSAGSRVFQQAFGNQSIASSHSLTLSANWTAGPAGAYKVAVGVFNNDWTQNYSWNSTAATINVGAATTPPPTTNPPPSSGAVTDIWWPTNGASVSGVLPFKAMLEGYDVSQYNMYWQVDGGALVQMGNSATDYPHKESLVDVSGWNWSGNHQYTLTFVSKDLSSKVISQKSEVIIVQ